GRARTLPVRQELHVQGPIALHFRKEDAFMLVNRRRFLQAGIGAAGAAALAGPLASTARSGGFWYPWGLDISNWQGAADWNAMTDAGLQFCIIKATEGTTFRDGQFARNWSEMRRRWTVRGAYHYARPNLNAVAQANFFHSVVRPGN